ncbi:MAG: hypothetical protein OEY49_04815 [Candidatus Heimdallarchaeota archaeon]|nr:hypothetical protein [Candidatus Heimdallarchaeota archaeon]
MIPRITTKDQYSRNKIYLPNNFVNFNFSNFNKATLIIGNKSSTVILQNNGNFNENITDNITDKLKDYNFVCINDKINDNSTILTDQYSSTKIRIKMDTNFNENHKAESYDHPVNIIKINFIPIIYKIVKFGKIISKLLHSLNKKISNRKRLFDVFNGIENGRQKIGCMSGVVGNERDMTMLQIYPPNLQSTSRRSSFSKWRFSQSLFSRPLNGGLEMIKT